MKPDAEQSDIDSGAVQADDSTIDFRPAPEMWGADTENVNATTANIFSRFLARICLTTCCTRTCICPTGMLLSKSIKSLHSTLQMATVNQRM